MKFRATVIFSLCMLFAAVLSAEPPRYTLIIASQSGKLNDLLAGLIERKFPKVDVQVLNHMARYKAKPAHPVPVCMDEEYFLLGPADALLGLGCIDAPSLIDAVRQIDGKIKAYDKRLTVDATLR